MYSNAGYVYSQLSGPKGLINLGSTCYVNGILQCLMGIKDLISLLAKQKENGPLSSALSDVLLSLDSVGEAEDISEFMCIIAEHWENYRPNTQMDSEEFLTFLLLAIHEEMKSKSGNLEVVIGSDMIQNCINAWTCHNTSSISSLFCVQIVTLTFCPNCKYSHGQYSDINSHLSVELPLVEHKTKQEMKKAIRLEECLLSFTKEEEQTDAICSTCKSVGLKHRLIIGRLPPVLVIHLKRFKLHYNGSHKKIVKEVSIPEHLDLAPYTVELLQSNTSYTLIGMTDHHGTSIHNGHYTAVSLRDERWYRFDDTKVSSTTSRKLGSTSNTAYLVWYRLKKDVEGDLPLDKIPMTLTDKAAFIANTPEVQSNTSCSNNDIDRNFINSDGESEVDMFAITDESDTDSDDRIFQIKMPKSNTSTAREWHPDKAARALNNLTVSDPSQQEANHVPPLQLCDHPLYDLDIMDPQLTEDDVPGAKLNIDDIDMCDVGTLKRWLQCRRITTTVIKADLKSRVIFHVLNGKENKIYQGFEEGKWYEEKRKRLMAEAHASNQKSMPMMPFGPKIFQPFPSVHIPNNYSSEKARDYLDLIPDIRFSYKGGVESRNGHEAEEEVEVDFSQPTQEDRKNIFVDGTLKRANNFIDSGRVLGITDCIRNLHYFVKADVKASYTNTIYKVSVMIAKLSGHVCFAECTCKARSLGRCCHIMAVLLLIGRHVASKGHEAVTCTGRLCYWLAPSSATHRRPGVVHEKNEYNKTSSNFKRRADFDPRPTNQQLLCDPDRVNLLRAELNGMTNKLLWYYQLLESPITADSYPDVVATYQIAEMCSHLIWNLNSIRNCSTSRPIHLLKTAEQSGNDFWHSERSVRITASVAKVVLGLSMDSSRMSFMRKHVWGLDPFSNAGMQRGNEMEGPARNAYRHHLKQADADIDILESGSWVNPAFPSLSCSPDGLIVNTNGIIRLLEIKCPAVLTEMDPNHFEKLPKRQLSSFCIKRDERTGQLELKPTHKWYYQVQMSLSIMQLEWCDFVVYSTVQNIPKFMIVKVQYNEEFWREKRERLISIHRQWFVPEHFLGNTIFNRPPVRLIYAPFHEEHDDEFFLFGSHLTDEDQSNLHETEDGFLIDLI